MLISSRVVQYVRQEHNLISIIYHGTDGNFSHAIVLFLHQIPAGLTTTLSVELCVSDNRCDNSAPCICHDLEIYFQGGHLSLPIKASIQIT